MKKSLFILPMFLLLLAGCGQNDPDPSSEVVTTSDTTSETTSIVEDTSEDTTTSESSEDGTTSETTSEAETTSETESTGGDTTSEETSTYELDLPNMEAGAFGEETVAVGTRRGLMTYWNDQNYVGSKVEVTTFEYVEDSYNVSYNTVSGSNWFGMQIFYKAPESAGLDTWATLPTIYLDFTSDVAGSITVNGKVVEIVAGENNIEVESNFAPVPTLADLSIQFGVNGGDVPQNTTMISAANIEFTRIAFEK